MKNDRSGFTIIEVLISLVILVVALFALSSLQTASIGSNASSQQRTIAVILVQDKMEELINLDYTDPQLSDTSANFDQNQNYFDWSLAVDHTNADGVGAVANPIDENGNNVAANGYTRVWNIVDDFPANNMKLISVRVSWSFKGARSVTVDGIISRE
ncbi:MAG: prepilin-type N-terminal cleavage/methylation domain-containing protein [Deltaproteobacteria bacterium]|nr:prepilin-type N-terminal cleavage/methylation domain-containing protein [Deltaproteobacteria bacterium]MBW2052233.1 prepilin-type N-terminal cleavage/methylation domain-containing protein [Deltaproteobacteria bacterium]MBW2141034.1 prepilin-type N-terminal cleavage/methylation domain-containing protein [Deltaproteobacteria bacterium]MBW2322060.1 prepilin-type N-terminal cleavage/methylation domain-containing protein [Deltaproteobacteria bacterium]